MCIKNIPYRVVLKIKWIDMYKAIKQYLACSKAKRYLLTFENTTFKIISDPQRMLIRELELLYLTFNCVPWEESPSLGFNFFIHKMVRNVGSLSDGTRSAVSGVQTLGIPLPLNVGWTEMLLLR